MKKSQILAALALAFALGVATPAMTFAADGTPSAHVDTGNVAEKSATNDNLKSAVNYVTSNKTYQAYVALAKATEAVKDVTADAKDVKSANEALVAAIQNFTGATTTAGEGIAALNANISNLKNAVGGDYSKWEALYDAVNVDASKIGSEAAINGVAKAMQDLGYTFNIEPTDTVFADVVTKAKDVVDDDDKTNDYDNYIAAVAAVNGAVSTRDLFNNLKTALSNANISLNKGDAAKVAAAENITTLKAINANDVTEWGEVAEQITEIEAAIKNENGTTNEARFLLLNNETAGQEGLLQLMQTATDNDDLTYAELISAAPTTPTDPTDPEEPSQPINPADPEKPGTNDGKGDGNTTTDKTPNTGVVAEGADASAKSSVSIMAGVSSFITAAGSALVAIRRGKGRNI